MTRTILITGATDGIGLETAKLIRKAGHNLLLHGRNSGKLEQTHRLLSDLPGTGAIERFQADLSDLIAVGALADEVLSRVKSLDVIINNAGVFHIADPQTVDGLDARFAVNTIAPTMLARSLAELLGHSGRIINLSSAAQAPVMPGAIEGTISLSDNAAYSQSKLALTMVSRQLAEEWGEQDPSVIAVNPGSFLATKMVKEAYGLRGNDLSIGAEILARAAIDPDFGKQSSGRYFDNDRGDWGQPHPDALDRHKNAAVLNRIDGVLGRLGLGTTAHARRG